MKFVQTCRLYRGLPNGLQNNNSAKAEGQTAKDRAEQKVGGDQNVVCTALVSEPDPSTAHPRRWGCGLRGSRVFASGRGRGFCLQLAAIGFPPSCLTATTLLAARLAPD